MALQKLFKAFPSLNSRNEHLRNYFFFPYSFTPSLWNAPKQRVALERATSFPSRNPAGASAASSEVIFRYCTSLSGPVRKAPRHSSTISYAWRNIRRARGRGGETNSEIARFFASRERSPPTARSSLPENPRTAALRSVDSTKKKTQATEICPPKDLFLKKKKKKSLKSGILIEFVFLEINSTLWPSSFLFLNLLWATSVEVCISYSETSCCWDSFSQAEIKNRFVGSLPAVKPWCSL